MLAGTSSETAREHAAELLADAAADRESRANAPARNLRKTSKTRA
jgi:hypothetical protein